MDHWWVNQNQSHEHEVHKDYLWAPKRKANGARNEFYDNMTRVRPGDIVFSYYRAAIRAVGIVASQCREAPYPREQTPGKVRILRHVSVILPLYTEPIATLTRR